MKSKRLKLPGSHEAWNRVYNFRSYILISLSAIFLTSADFKRDEHAFTTLLTVTFDSDEEGNEYATNTFSASNDVWARSTGANGPNNNTAVSYTNLQGAGWWNGEDIDDSDNALGAGEDGYIILKTINVSAYQGGTIQVKAYLGANTSTKHRFEVDDYVLLRYAFDGNMATGANSDGGLPTSGNVNTGTYTTFGAFYGTGNNVVTTTSSALINDADLDGDGDFAGTAGIPATDTVTADSLKNALAEWTFSFDVGATDTRVSILIQAATNGGSEEVAIDDIVVSAEAGVTTFTSLFSETFESDGNGSSYRSNTFSSATTSSAATDDFWGRWDMATNPAGPNAKASTSGRNFFQAYSGQQGDYAFGAEDVDDDGNPLGTGKPGYLVFETLNVSAYQSGNAKIELLLGASTEGNSRYEVSDYLRIEYAFDSDIATGATSVGSVPTQANLETGTYSIAGAFYGGVGGTNTDIFEDTDLNGAGNSGATTLTTTLSDQDFTFSIPASATTMSVRVTVLGGSAEEFVIDNIRISAEAGVSAPTSATVAASVFLEGAYNGSSLNTTINGSIPSAQPYSGSAYNSHAGTESASAPAGAVDWVLVEVREAGSAAAALNSTKVGSAAGFLMSDGSIKATNGTSNLTVSLSGNSGADFYVVIYHRNHLPIMSASAISESSGTYTIDFTSSAANTYQTTAALASLSGGKFGMPAGDIDQDGDIDATDLGTWRSNNGIAFSYGSNGAADFNLDGKINAVDRNDFHQKNTSKTRQVPSS